MMMNLTLVCTTLSFLISLSTVISSPQRHRSAETLVIEKNGVFSKAVKNSRYQLIAEGIRAKIKRDMNSEVGSILEEGKMKGKRKTRESGWEKIKGEKKPSDKRSQRRKSEQLGPRDSKSSVGSRNKELRNRQKEYLVVNRTLELLERKTARAAEHRKSSAIVFFGRGIAPEIIGQILAENRGAPIGIRRIADLLIRKTKLASVADKNDDHREMTIKNNETDTNRDQEFDGEGNGYVKYNNEYDNPFEEPEDVAVSHLFDGASVPSASVYLPDVDDRNALREGLSALLARLFETLSENNEPNENNDNPEELLRKLDFDIYSLQGTATDLCQKWLDCEEKLEEAFLGDLRLPACPCHYPSRIFYEDKIWDDGERKYFRWRDVSGETERLDVYKPGASYCIRSLLARGTGSAAAQHCCYDTGRRLLSRGSGAGTPNFISPEISPVLHERIDILPWRLCKGDFSRFNEVRTPNNDNRCEVNPDEDEYMRQIESTRHY